MNGYAGKILRIDLSSRKIGIIPTRAYESWVGGHGMGSAIFWDIVVKEKGLDLESLDGFSPDNVVTIMTSPLSGTLVPAGSGRTEVQGIGVQSHPIGWFTRSNFGGRFSTQLKQAGWDGIVIEGRATRPCWIDIRNNNVKIRESQKPDLWGMSTADCQQAIYDDVVGDGYGDWIDPADEGDGYHGSKTTQLPAVLAIGPAGENLSRIACLIHDVSKAAGQGGFGAVWGSKNLKAISVIGTGNIKIARPEALIQARISQTRNYGFDAGTGKAGTYFFPDAPRPLLNSMEPQTVGQRPAACAGCHSACRARYESGLANEAHCKASAFYSTVSGASDSEIQYRAVDLINQHGINAYDVDLLLYYIRDLHSMGALGPGKPIDCDLDFEDYGSLEFVQDYLRKIAYREGAFGDAIAEGSVRAAERWGRLDEDLSRGLLQCPYWGFPEHGLDPRADVTWGYSSIMADRDMNEHDFTFLYWEPNMAAIFGETPVVTAEEAVTIFANKMVPYLGNTGMLDFSTDNIYSTDMAKGVSWHRHFTRFWKQSVLFCDQRWWDAVNPLQPDNVGSSGKAEPIFFNIVTGKNFSFHDGIKLGRKIWNLDQAIWTLQGRHRDMVHFADYIYQVPFGGPTIGGTHLPFFLLPGRVQGAWQYVDVSGRHLDREKFEEWKTRFYIVEGWDPASGYPTRTTLEGLGLGAVADALEAKGRLGYESP